MLVIYPSIMPFQSSSSDESSPFRLFFPTTDAISSFLLNTKLLDALSSPFHPLSLTSPFAFLTTPSVRACLYPGVTGQIAHVPEGVWLALEERDDDGGAGGQGWYGALEEGDEERLVVADLAVHVCGLASDVGEVEDYAIEVVFIVVAFAIGVLVLVLATTLAFATFCFFGRSSLVIPLDLLRLGSITANHSNVVFDVGILGQQFVCVLLQNSRSNICAAMMLNDRRRETQITLSDKEYAVVRVERYRGRINGALLFAFTLLGGAIDRFLRDGYLLDRFTVLNMFLLMRTRRWLMRQLSFLAPHRWRLGKIEALSRRHSRVARG
ncbi:hypothetical protein HG530_013958 [Fusarium avenaceum]|nr:hypothetical protein HG530_013958 [Fusarium avenaceum]